MYTVHIDSYSWREGDFCELYRQAWVYNVRSEVCIVSYYVQVTMYFDPLLCFVYYVSIVCGM
jgi:hypothetical protein